MLAPNVLLNITLLTQNLYIPLNKLLQTEYVRYTTLVYNDYSIDVATAVSNAIEGAHTSWKLINVDKTLNASRYNNKSEKKTNAQDRELIILTQNVKISSKKTYCFGSVLCSYLVIVEKESFFYDRENIRNLFLKVRYGKKWVLAILFYTKFGNVDHLYFMADNHELIHLDAMQFDNKTYTRVFREQYKVYRNYVPLSIFVGPFSDNIYKIKTKTPGGDIISEGVVAGNFVYLANMIGRYLDARVLICKQEQFEFYRHDSNLSEILTKKTETEQTYKAADEVLPYRVYIKNLHSITVSFGYEDDALDLYPHDFTEYVFLVPKNFKEENALWGKLLNSPLFTVWASATAVFTIGRILVRKVLIVRFTDNTSRNDLIYILFNTFGLSFGTTSAHGVHSRAELILILFVSLFNVLAGVLCASFLFGQFAITNYVPFINSFEEFLSHTELHLIRPRIPGFSSNIFPNESKEEIVTPYLFQVEFVMEINNSFGFMLPKRNAMAVISNDALRFHMIPDRKIFPDMFSVIAFPYYRRINILFQRLVEQGLIEYFHKKQLRNQGIKDDVPTSAKSSFQSLNIFSIAFADLRFMLIVVMVGMLASIGVFIVEVIVGNLCVYSTDIEVHNDEHNKNRAI